MSWAQADRYVSPPVLAGALGSDGTWEGTTGPGCVRGLRAGWREGFNNSACVECFLRLLHHKLVHSGLSRV